MSTTRGRDRLFVNASALMLSSVVTGALGLAYWILAGRLFDATTVGRASALISTATMLSSVACLSLGGSYQRFLPSAGRLSARLIGVGYLLVASVAIPLGFAFAFSPLSHHLLTSTTERVGFAGMVLVFALFALTDAVLTGLRRAPDVAIKNITASVVKILPLLMFSGSAATIGIVASWTGISLLLTVVFVVIALRVGIARRWPSTLPPPRVLVSYQSAFLAMMLVAATLPFALPLIVVHRLGIAENAYFNLAWTMCTAVGLLRGAMGSAFIVEASTPGADRRALLQRMMPIYLGVAGLTAIGLAVGGPLVLWATGPEYFAGAWLLMVVMGVVSVLEAIVGGFYATAQLLGHLRLMTAIQCLTVVVTLMGAYLFTPALSITAVGLAEGVAMLLALLVVRRPLVRGIRTLRADARFAPGSVDAPSGSDSLDHLASTEADGFDAQIASHSS